MNMTPGTRARSPTAPLSISMRTAPDWEAEYAICCPPRKEDARRTSGMRLRSNEMTSTERRPESAPAPARARFADGLGDIAVARGLKPVDAPAEVGAPNASRERDFAGAPAPIAVTTPPVRSVPLLS